MDVKLFGELRRIAAAAAAFSLAACAPQAQAPQTAASAAPAARPAMWTLSDEDTIIYLFGTIHLLPEGRQWRTPAMEAALGSADELVFEVAAVDDPAVAAQAAAGAMMRLGISPGLPPLVERVPAEKRAELEAMVAESGVPMAVLDRVETWAAAMSLMGVIFKRLGLDPELGVETRLGSDWKARGKPVGGLETVDEQFGFFDTLSEEAQRAFLVSVLEKPEDTRREFEAMLAAWASGDVDAVARTFDDEKTMSAELRAALMTRRNARWAEWLEERLEQPGTVFVAVGAGHLAGRDSVQEMLKAKGLKTKRVQ